MFIGIYTDGYGTVFCETGATVEAVMEAFEITVDEFDIDNVTMYEGREVRVERMVTYKTCAVEG